MAQTPQPTAQQNQPAQPAQLDQNVVALMHAVRDVETPSGNAVAGASGELPSRFQYTSGTWKGVAQKYLGDANAPLNAANENKATYLRFKDWKDQGYKPYQIAAMHNAGEGRPDAYKDNVGTNSFGVHYDTPTYVQKVMGNFQNEIGKIKQNQPQQPQGDGFFTSLAKNILNPFARAGVTAYNVGSSAIKGLEGDQQGAQAELDKSRDLPFLGKTAPVVTGTPTQPISQDIKNIVGTGLEIGSNFVGGEGAVGVGEQSLKGLIGNGVKEGLLTGVTAGGAQGAGSALSQGESLGQAGIEGLKGAAIGGLLGAPLGAAGGILGKGIGEARKFFAPTEDEIVNTYKEALNLGRAELKRLKPGQEDEVAKLMVQDGIPLNSQDRGTKFDTTSETIPVAEQNRDKFEEALQGVLNEYKGQKTINLEDVRSAAKKEIESNTNLAADVKNKRLAHVDNLLDQEISARGQIVDPAEANQIKRGLYKIGYDMTSAEKTPAAQALGRAFKKSIEDNTNSAVVKALNKRLGLYQETLDLLQSMHGKAIRGGRLGAGLSRIAGNVIGAKFGPFGSLAGGEISARLQAIINDPERVSFKAINDLKKLGVMPDSVKTLEQAKAFITKLKLDLEGRKMPLGLPAPTEPGKFPTVYGHEPIAPQSTVPEFISKPSQFAPNAPQAGIERTSKPFIEGTVVEPNKKVKITKSTRPFRRR